MLFIIIVILCSSQPDLISQLSISVLKTENTMKIPLERKRSCGNAIDSI